MGWRGINAGERNADNAMGSVAGITKGYDLVPFANLPSSGRPSEISIVHMSRAGGGMMKTHFVKTQGENCK